MNNKIIFSAFCLLLSICHDSLNLVLIEMAGMGLCTFLDCLLNVPILRCLFALWVGLFLLHVGYYYLPTYVLRAFVAKLRRQSLREECEKNLGT